MFIRIIFAVLSLLSISVSGQAADKKIKIKEISFSVMANAEQEKNFKDKIVPWASIKNAEADSLRLIDANLKVITEREVILMIDYPIREPANFKITSAHGFTKAELLRKIGQVYRKMYAEEETSSTVKTIPRENRKGSLNRNTTNGKYGIWGHDIDDLDLSSARIACESNFCVVELEIQS